MEPEIGALSRQMAAARHRDGYTPLLQRYIREESAAPDSRPRGTRLPQNQVKLRRQASNGQYSITIPAGVAKALRCEGGEVFEVFIEKGGIVLHLLSR